MGLGIGPKGAQVCVCKFQLVLGKVILRLGQFLVVRTADKVVRVDLGEDVSRHNGGQGLPVIPLAMEIRYSLLKDSARKLAVETISLTSNSLSLRVRSTGG